MSARYPLRILRGRAGRVVTMNEQIPADSIHDHREHSMGRATKSPNRRYAALLWVGITVLFVLPAQFGLYWLNGNAPNLQGLLAGIGIVGLLIASSALARPARLTWGLLAGFVVLALFFVRMLFFGLVNFSGKGFGPDFFISLQLESVRVAWDQYFYLFVMFGVGAALLLTGFMLVARRLWTPRPGLAIGTAIVSVLLIASGYSATPVWQLASAANDWYAPKKLQALPPARHAMWEKSLLLNVNLVAKQVLRAQAANPPKNLILLYIESGGVAMAPASQYPGLMPNMKRLIADQSLVKHIHASSYVTIEGLVNTECGTLFPFAHENDSMAGFDHMMDQMPCLGDVLAAAGYQQSYLGGSGKSFAGKGRFLETHGYNKVMGLHDWAKLDIHQRPDTWGVSDVDLFKQSFLELKRLKASGQPFNLTMLTIGSHLPGFFYKECTRYGDGSKRFLNAVHCSDELIGRWVKKLRADGWLDSNTILAITGDHQLFPNPLMKSLFGATAVEDHRLPFIVIGKDLPKPALQDGAGYDIAPTLLDLLGIKTNARFALGRSLMRNDRQLDYYPSRFLDMLGESTYIAKRDFDCSKNNNTRVPGAQPLSVCERKELDALLQAQAQAYSAPLTRLRCDGINPLQMDVPVSADAPMRLIISGDEQAGRFTWQQRHREPSQPGLYLLTLDGHGKLLERKFAPPEDVVKTFATQPPMPQANALLVAWRPGEKPVVLPAWLHHMGVTDGGGGWLFVRSAAGNAVLEQQVPLGTTLTVDRQQCKSLLAAPESTTH